MGSFVDIGIVWLIQNKCRLVQQMAFCWAGCFHFKVLNLLDRKEGKVI